MSDRDQALAELRSKLKAKKKEPVRGLGDVVHRVTEALGMDHCDECAKRRERMNRWIRLGGEKDDA